MGRAHGNMSMSLEMESGLQGMGRCVGMNRKLGLGGASLVLALCFIWRARGGESLRMR